MPGETASGTRVRIHHDTDIVAARQAGRALGGDLGFSASEQAMVVTAISELARNILDYAREGEVELTLVGNGARRGLQVIARDQGPGIPDVGLAMQDGYSTGKGLGLGLPGTRRLMDDFEIESVTGKGTTVTARKWVR